MCFLVKHPLSSTLCQAPLSSTPCQAPLVKHPLQAWHSTRMHGCSFPMGWVCIPMIQACWYRGMEGWFAHNRPRHFQASPSGGGRVNLRQYLRFAIPNHPPLMGGDVEYKYGKHHIFLIISSFFFPPSLRGGSSSSSTRSSSSSSSSSSRLVAVVVVV